MHENLMKRTKLIIAPLLVAAMIIQLTPSTARAEILVVPTVPVQSTSFQEQARARTYRYSEFLSPCVIMYQ